MRPSNLSRLVLSLSIAAALGLPAAGCSKSPAPAAASAAAPAAAVEKVVDEHSYAEPAKVRTTDLALDLAIDFAKKTISGTATYSLDWVDKAATQLALDSRDISIQKAEGQGADGKWTDLKFSLGGKDPIRAAS